MKMSPVTTDVSPGRLCHLITMDECLEKKTLVGPVRVVVGGQRKETLGMGGSYGLGYLCFGPLHPGGCTPPPLSSSPVGVLDTLIQSTQ